MNMKAAYNWYPGHIAKAEKELKEKMKLIDVIIELRDARAPYATAHKDLRAWAGTKPIILVLNKSDLADPLALKEFRDNFNKADYASEVFFFNAKNIVANNIKTAKVQDLIKLLDKIAVPIRAKFEAKGVRSRPVRVMVVGYPNTGKSTLINKLSSSKKAKVQNKPGVTRSQQWVDVVKNGHAEIKLLDTPGIIPPKFYSEQQALMLALCNCLGDKAFDHVLVAKAAIEHIDKHYHQALMKLYKDELSLEALAERSKLELDKMGRKIIQDFRDGRMGLVSLEI